MTDVFEAIALLGRRGEGELRRLTRTAAGVIFSSIRMEAVFRRVAAAENGTPRRSSEYRGAALGITVLAAVSGATGFGFSGLELSGEALAAGKLIAQVRSGFAAAYERARFNARQYAALRKALALGKLGEAWAAVAPVRAQAAPVYHRDPRAISEQQLQRLCVDTSREVGALGAMVIFNTVSAFSELRQELFISSDGAAIDQGFAFSQGDCYVVAQSAHGHQESYDSIGQQRGLECLVEGHPQQPMPNPPLPEFALELAREACTLAQAPPLRPPAGEVVVVTDPHFNALLAHEIVGHPSEADRALKTEAGYAGRSWFLRSLQDQAVGQPVGSPALSACSDPTLEGYGHYLYDHEGTPGRRVPHIERGIYRGFLNSRATAALLGVAPNGSARASAGQYAPLIRMSNTFFLPGERRPQEIIAEVEHGYYVCGHRIPSIAESRENFRISARRVYEIEHGRLGRLFRAGSVAADSRSFFMNVDAAGNDLRLIAIPNCGKGQPMQVKRMANGGPTLRSRARLYGA
jgi:TldD protein